MDKQTEILKLKELKNALERKEEIKAKIDELSEDKQWCLEEWEEEADRIVSSRCEADEATDHEEITIKRIESKKKNKAEKLSTVYNVLLALISIASTLYFICNAKTGLADSALFTEYGFNTIGLTIVYVIIQIILWFILASIVSIPTNDSSDKR